MEANWLKIVWTNSFKIASVIFVTILFSCGRTKDPDELVLHEFIFDENGVYYQSNCASHCNYKKYNGTDTCFYENGVIKGTFTITNGMPDGHWEQFNPNGSKKLDMYFENGEMVGKTRF